MPTQKSSDLASNYPLIAEHFAPRPFHSNIFLLATAAFCGIPIVMLLFRFRLHNFDLDVLRLSLVGVTVLAGAWWQTFKIYSSIHRLFHDGQIEKFEENSALDKVLRSTSKLIL